MKAGENRITSQSPGIEDCQSNILYLFKILLKWNQNEENFTWKGNKFSTDIHYQNNWRKNLNTKANNHIKACVVVWMLNVSQRPMC
jgi:hypothetical protein